MIDLLPCTNVETVGFSIGFWPLETDPHALTTSRLWSILSPTFLQRCRTLRSIHIVFLFVQCAVYDIIPYDIAPLDEALSALCEVTPNITVKIAPCLCRGGEGIFSEATLTQWLPQLVARGVVKFCDLEQVGMTKVKSSTNRTMFLVSYRVFAFVGAFAVLYVLICLSTLLE